MFGSSIRNIHNLKIWIRLVGVIWLMLMLAWSGMILWASHSQRATAIEEAKSFSLAIHQMTMSSLTGMMITGTIAQRAVFLDQIKQADNITSLKVLRSEGVSKQFGPGNAEEGGMDALEKQVMQNAKPYFQVLAANRQDEEILRAVIPVTAEKNYLGKDCLLCHTVPEGTVLGAVSMKISLDKVNKSVADFRAKIFLAAVLISIPLLAFIYLFIRRFVTKPLEEMAHGLHDIAAGEGDLTRRLKVRSADEIGEAADLFNQVMEKFGQLVHQVNNSALQVSAAARQLALGAQQVVDSSERQRDKSAATAAAVEEMAASISTVAQNTDEVQQLSEQSLERSHQGNESISMLVGEVDQVESAVKDIAAAVNEFTRSTASIHAMTRQVKDIAEQTNLLALNAAIEAARAGEQGRGFAVVADEVRKLAEKSSQSASQIDTVTQSLAQQSVTVDQAIERGLSHLLSSQDSMETVAIVLSEANSSVNAVGSKVADVAVITERQRSTSCEVAANVEAIAAMAAENSLAVGQTAKAAQHLEQLAESLQNTVSRFKV
ncbi:MAG: methyl-accepting chemotaxis protein [Sulfurimicrobium sp.]|jgi:methyl-accepting chemotaxis protein|nr:methyl-accepting chemotaxis protein [Sulfurimicrobium sp.]MDP1705581.1 methyl-accepting chemotaxis protein [Sulfurimicrobium sp.]MDP2197593.1 methyl-accepting chemotaxis protein [Sulfurimicrobium sp.]MDP2961289.1 methyl-accepting chemotaxis protein [Sulfurimicrobium sp.]MDP3686285.1 methyl-accepting chemotaxis protein [Sulfurimicrobium sp.]